MGDAFRLARMMLKPEQSYRRSGGPQKRRTWVHLFVTLETRAKGKIKDCTCHPNLNCQPRRPYDACIRFPCLSVYSFYKHDRRIRSLCGRRRDKVCKDAGVNL